MKRNQWAEISILPLAIILIALSFFLDSYAQGLSTLGTRFPVFFGILSANMFVSMLFVVIPFVFLLLRRRFRLAGLLVVTVAVGFVLSIGLKIVLARARPETAIDLFTGAHAFSLPSSHAFVVFATLPFIAIALPRINLVFWLLAASVAFSRLALGVHYLSDVIFGAILGLGLSHLIIAAESRPTRLRAFELRRKAVHILVGVCIAFLIYHGLLISLTLALLFVIGLLLSLAERQQRLPVISKLLDLFERGSARKRFPGEGAIYYFLGAAIATFFFPPAVAAAGVMVLAIGDAISHLLGVSFGRIKNPLNNKKFIEGWIAGLVAAFFGALLFVSPREAFVAALAGMIVEAIDLTILKRRVNDNLVMPAAAGFAIMLLRMVR